MLLRTVRRRLGLIAGMTLVSVLVAGYLARREPPAYRASAVIRLEDKTRSMAGGLVGDATNPIIGRSADPLLSQIQVLTSRAVAEAVVDSIPILRASTEGFSLDHVSGLWLQPSVRQATINLRFAPSAFVASVLSNQKTADYGVPVEVAGVRFSIPYAPDATEGLLSIAPKDRAVSSLLGQLDVTPRENTDVVDVSVRASDPYVAQSVVNRVVRTFRAVNATAAQQQAHLRRLFLESQLRHNDSLLTEARAALTEFRARARTLSARQRFLDEQRDIGSIAVRRQELDAERRTYQTLLNALAGSDRTAGDLRALVAAPEIAANPVVAALYQQLDKYELARDSLTTGRYSSAPGNPDVQRLDTLIASTQSKLIGAVKSVIAALNARMGALDALRTQSSSAFAELSSSEAEETELLQHVETAAKLAGDLRAEYQKAQLAEAVEVGQVEVVDSAVLSKQPIGTRLRVKLGFGLVFGLVLGTGTAVALELLNTSVRRQGQVQTLLNVAELAIIPPSPRQRGRLPQRSGTRGDRLPSKNGQRQLGGGLVVVSDAQSIAAEAYRLLRTNLLFSLPEASPRTILVTSPAPGDGKTTVAANLAIAFAHQGMRVLLMDADMRRGRVHDVFKIARHPGLSEILLGNSVLGSAARATSIVGLDVLPNGTVPDAPSELVGSERLRTLLEEATQTYAITVIDSPPVLATADPALISTISEATVLVVRAGRTDGGEAQVALEQLMAVGAKVVGAVLNDPDSTVRAYGGYYYSKYYG
jgi:tyrosine-protein kinase Etk/Wzc